MNKIQLPHSENEKYLIDEQNAIKKYLTCIAVYDLPIGSDKIPSGYTFDTIGTFNTVGYDSVSIFTTKYNKDRSKAEYKLFAFKNKK